MKDNNRRAAVLEIIRAKTAANTSTRETARQALIAEGIYTPAGKLREEFKPARQSDDKAKPRPA